MPPDGGPAAGGGITAAGAGWGVVFGGVFAAVGYGLTGGRRDFTSRSATVPSRFEVLVAAGHSERANTLLASQIRRGEEASPIEQH